MVFTFHHQTIIRLVINLNKSKCTVQSKKWISQKNKRKKINLMIVTSNLFNICILEFKSIVERFSYIDKENCREKAISINII